MCAQSRKHKDGLPFKGMNMGKMNSNKKNRKRRWTRPAVAFSLAAILFGAGNALAQSSGYITKNDETERDPENWTDES